MIVWYQPHQQFCENTHRVAHRRRLPEDDQWVVPHNLYLMMFSPASVNVLPFDPLQGADAARAYATKYCRSMLCFCCLLLRTRPSKRMQ